jgi:hypothetical protein
MRDGIVPVSRVVYLCELRQNRIEFAEGSLETNLERTDVDCIEAIDFTS